jgi:membrane associated rhomboid family serine protease/Zn-finger nucleic acid-binding protein
MALLCPECRTPMAAYPQGSVTLDVCARCHGLWFDAGELAKVEPMPLEWIAAPLTIPRLRVRHCPRCSRGRLERVEARAASALCVDRCDKCGGFFLERGLLDRLRRYKARERARVEREEARQLREHEARVREFREPPPSSGIEFESTLSGNVSLVTVLLDLPSEEHDDTTSIPWAVYGLGFAILCAFLWQCTVLEATWLPFTGTRDNLVSGQHLYTLLTLVFLHADGFHIFGNLYFFWLFGDDVEEQLGTTLFLASFFLWAVGSSIAGLWMVPPEFGAVPNLGASGAISGALGAYLVLKPHKRIVTPAVNVAGLGVVAKVPAWLYLVPWIGFQWVAAVRHVPGVGWWAHISGFVLGSATAAAYRAYEGSAARRANHAAGRPITNR